MGPHFSFPFYTVYDMPPVAVGGTMLFAADDGTNGLELWRSDGTSAGTMLVADINPGPAGSLPTQRIEAPTRAVALGGVLLFAANDGSSGLELWHSDGTPGGTSMVADIHPGPSSSLDPTDKALVVPG